MLDDYMYIDTTYVSNLPCPVIASSFFHSLVSDKRETLHCLVILQKWLQQFLEMNFIHEVKHSLQQQQRFLRNSSLRMNKEEYDLKRQ